MAELNLMDKYPRSVRKIDERAKLITEEHRAVARLFDERFFDGDRLTGYGGYNYHPRFWTDTVKKMRDHYGLAPDASVLDVGCGKGFMMQDFQKLMPDMTVRGVDISEYAIENTMTDMKENVSVGDASSLSFEGNSYDLVISINTVHNLPLDKCKTALKEIERVSCGDSFIIVDAWRTEDEKRRMLDWNLTALTYMHVDDWVSLFEEVGYTGDYYWFIAE